MLNYFIYQDTASDAYSVIGSYPMQLLTEDGTGTDSL